jgi:hypothetical protein
MADVRCHTRALASSGRSDEEPDVTGVPNLDPQTHARWRDRDPLAARSTDGPDRSPAAPPSVDAAAVLAGRELTWLDQLEVAAAAERDETLADLSDDQLTVEVGRQAARVAAATARYLQLLAEVLVRGLWADHGARTPAHWLSHEVGVGASTAADHVRVALRLRELPLIRSRFASGTLSYTKVRAITRVAVPELEPMLVEWCASATGAEVERIVRAFRRTARRPTAPDAGRTWQRRSNGDGTSTLTITAPDADIAELEAVCDRIVDREEAEDAASGGSAQDSADGSSAEDEADGSSAEDEADGSSAEDGDRRERPRQARLVDALLNLVAAARHGDVDTSGLDRHTLVLHTDAHDLIDATADAADRDLAVWDTGGRVRTMSARVLRRLACQAGIRLVAEGPEGPLDAGRRRREPSVAQRRALLARDRSCRFPGCGATRHLHAHHVVHWADGGPTDLRNLVTICAFHHRFVHERGWQVTPAASGTFRFAPPDGPAVATAGAIDAADTDWAFDPDSGELLRPAHRHAIDELDLDLALFVLHQELARVTGPRPTADRRSSPAEASVRCR